MIYIYIFICILIIYKIKLSTEQKQVLQISCFKQVRKSQFKDRCENYKNNDVVRKQYTVRHAKTHSVDLVQKTKQRELIEIQLIVQQ